jgi:hypothetical protein
MSDTEPDATGRETDPTEGDMSVFPPGFDYLDATFGFETECEEVTARYLPAAGKKAPHTWASLGDGLAILDALSSCRWGCRGGDHAVEYLLARVLGSARAATRLSRGGLYDESLNALRTANELVNLLMLFDVDRPLLESWRGASAKDRYYLARPSWVMERLAAAGRAGVSMDPSKYDLLSRIAHGNATSAPQAHNALGLPLTSGTFQEARFPRRTQRVIAHRGAGHRCRCRPLRPGCGAITVPSAQSGGDAKDRGRHHLGDGP